MKIKLFMIVIILLNFSLAFTESPNWSWVTKAGDIKDDNARSIVLDDSLNIYVSGYFKTTVTFGSSTITATGWNGFKEAYVAKMDKDGNWLWAISGGGAQNDYGYSIVLDNNANIYLTGFFRDTSTFGTTTLTFYGSREILVAKIDTNGNWLWIKSAGGIGDDAAVPITLDINDNLYITGGFSETATFGSTTLTSNGYMDIFVAKLDTNGNWLWARSAGGAGIDVGGSIALDEYGNIYLTGLLMDTVTFGSTTLTSYGEADILVAKMDKYGNWLWGRNAGSPETDFGVSIALADHGSNIYFTGFFRDTSTFGSTSFTSSGRTDIFVAKLRVEPTYYLTPADTTQIDFGLVYLTSQSADSLIVLENIGNRDISINSLSFMNGGNAFVYTYNNTVIPVGLKDTILVKFNPQTTGIFSDTLLISNSSTDNPNIKISLRGNCQYAPPKAPENITITITGNNAVISWDAVTQNIYNQAITPDGYRVLYRESPNDNYHLLYYQTNGLSYTHQGVIQLGDKMFYNVIAVIENNR